jgi:predicted secreted hydrolase
MWEFGMLRAYGASLTKKRLGKWNLIVLGLLFILLFPIKIYAEEFRRALPGKVFSFPQDHFSHPEFKTEWWYYSGHLQSQPPDKRCYGYQLTFFRTALRGETKTRKSKWSIQNIYFAHLALTDESKKKFEYREKISRGSLGEAGASTYKKDGKPFRVWIEDWSLEGKGPSMEMHLLKAGDKDFGIAFLLTPEKNPVVHGQNGVSQKGEGEGYASHYYSISRLKTEGKIFLRGKELSVQGMSWMDHEFGSSQLREYQTGWDWFSIRLDNQCELMFYQIRHRDGSINPYSSGTMIFADGTHHHLPLKAFQIKALEKWRSQKSGATYPSKWSIKVPDYRIELSLTPTVRDQELITKESTRVTYWEGSVRVEGKYQGDPIKGVGYVELTGYAKPFSKGI